MSLFPNSKWTERLWTIRIQRNQIICGGKQKTQKDNKWQLNLPLPEKGKITFMPSTGVSQMALVALLSHS